MPMPTVIKPVATYGDVAPNGEAAANRQAAGPNIPATCEAAQHRCMCIEGMLLAKHCEQEGKEVDTAVVAGPGKR